MVPFRILSQCDKILCLLRLQYNDAYSTVKEEIVAEHGESGIHNKGTKKGVTRGGQRAGADPEDL